MEQRTKHLASLLFTPIAFWIAASGPGLLVRFYGTHDTIDWATGPAAFIGIWLASGLVLAFQRQMSNMVGGRVLCVLLPGR